MAPLCAADPRLEKDARGTAKIIHSPGVCTRFLFGSLSRLCVLLVEYYMCMYMYVCVHEWSECSVAPSPVALSVAEE